MISPFMAAGVFVAGWILGWFCAWVSGAWKFEQQKGNGGISQ